MFLRHSNTIAGQFVNELETKGPEMAITVPAHKLAYMALPKAGCTSVKRALARIDPEVSTGDDNDVAVWHGLYQTRRFHPGKWAELGDHFRFCVVRDPVKRLMSCYSDIVAQRDILENSPRLRASKKYPLNPDPDYFFTYLDAYKGRSSLVKHHAMSATVFLGPDLEGAYDRVYRTHEMEELGRDLSRRTGQIVRMPHDNPATRKLHIHDLLDETIDKIRPFLEHEYEFLGAFFKNPLGVRLYKSCGLPS